MGKNKKKLKESEPNPEADGYHPGWVRPMSVLLGGLYLVAGVTKLMGTSFWIESFGRFQFPAWWALHAVGLAEALGGVLFLLGRKPRFTAGLLATTMLGAMITHLRVGEPLAALIPLVLLVPLALIFRESRIWGPSG